ncbi:MAG: AAA family ATPase [Caldilineaceae bacterium]|nr:AAA family ATPase [Caldilineaceae bacterium]
MQLQLYLFGPPRILRSGAPLDLSLRKALALLAYLAVTRQAHSRDALATLFWPDKDQQAARANLRRTLYDLSQMVGDHVIESAAELVAIHAKAVLGLDIEFFQRHIADAQAAETSQDTFDESRMAHLLAAVELYTADFMAGFSLADCPEYDDWQYFQREELRRAFAHALEEIVALYTGQTNWTEALRHARRWLALDPLEERTQRQVMQLYAQAGQPAAALRQYEECVRLLAQELDAPPDNETTALYEAIRTRRFPGRDKPAPIFGVTAGVMPAAFAPVHLPTQTTPFVGRRQELAELLRRLHTPDCRLLTIVGPGGMGKTRLAIEAAQTLLKERELEATQDTGQPQFKNGVYFVPLQPVNAPSRIVPAIAEALGLQFYGNEPPQRQLLNFLHGKESLLVLDNFEHLLDGAGLIADILAAAPGVKLLVTSREALKLQEEWFHPLAGMRLPPATPGPGAVDASDAVALFVQTARRAVTGFEPSVQQGEIVRICRMVAACRWRLNWQLPGSSCSPVRRSQTRSSAAWTFLSPVTTMCPCATAACAPCWITPGNCWVRKPRSYCGVFPSFGVGSYKMRLP